MKTALLVTLVLFLSLASISEGLRFDHGLKGLLHQRNYEKTNIVTEDEAEIISEDKHISSGRSRKLITNIPSTTSTTSKVVNTEGSKVEPKPKHQHEENFSIKSSPISSSSSLSGHHGEATNGKYPDIIDIAGMDYSPARRKPPIHN